MYYFPGLAQGLVGVGGSSWGLLVLDFSARGIQVVFFFCLFRFVFSFVFVFVLSLRQLGKSSPKGARSCWAQGVRDKAGVSLWLTSEA